MDYLTDGHGEGLEPSMDQSEVAYIARSNPGYKTDLEGGQVPLYGHGRFKGDMDSPELRRAFVEACQPVHPCGTTGYKSITMTVPKEVSLFLEAHREEGREAMQRAFGRAVEKMYPGFDVSAVGATHTRNSNGEVHWHVHGLVAKFAERKTDGRILSLNGKAVQGGKNPVHDFKEAWKIEVEAELKKEFGITVEQTTKNGPAKIITADGIMLPPLNRETRRQLERALEPRITVTGPDGQPRTSILKLNEMHSRIYTVAMRDKGRAGWDKESFKEMYPEIAGQAEKYDKMADRLKTFGYLTPEGRATQDFKNHATAKWGNQLTPELFKLRMELAQAAQGQAKKEGKPVAVPTLAQVAAKDTPPLWERVEKLEAIRRRIELLGYSPADVKRIEDQARKVAPTAEEKEAARQEAKAEYLRTHKGETLESTKRGEAWKGSIFSAFIDLQKARIQRTYLDLAGTVRPDFIPRKLEADKIVQGLERNIRERKAAITVRNENLSKLAIFSRELFRTSNLRRPVSYVLSRASRATTTKLERAKTTVSRIVSFQDGRAANREALLGERRITGEWKKEFLEKPLADLKAMGQRGEAPSQAAENLKLLELRASYRKLGIPEPTAKETQALASGILALERSGNPAFSRLEAFKGNEADLAKAVYVTAMQRDLNPGAAVPLEKEVFETAKQAKSIGDRVAKEYSGQSRTTNDGKTGTLLEHGAAKYNFKADEGSSYFVKYRVQGGEEKTVWGVDLKRAVEESQAKPGDRIRVENIGKQAVTIEVPKRDEQGKVVGTETKETHRNAWEVKANPEEGQGKATVAVPSNHAAMASDIDTINRRFEAYGLNAPFTAERLRELAPADTAKEIQSAREAGLLAEGPEWAVKRPAEMREYGQELENSIERNTDQAKGLEDQLINRRFQA